MTERLRIHLCHECGMDFLFKSDRQDHIASTGHRLFVVIELEDYNHDITCLKDVTKKDVTSRTAIADNIGYDDVSSNQFLKEHLLTTDRSTKESSVAGRHYRIFAKSKIILNSTQDLNYPRQESAASAAGNVRLYHGRIDWDVAKRILQVIYMDAPVRKTSLAMKARVNYSTCKKYVIWLEEIDWIAKDSNDAIRLAEAGS